jgi:hypothetical protein
MNSINQPFNEGGIDEDNYSCSNGSEKYEHNIYKLKDQEALQQDASPLDFTS